MKLAFTPDDDAERQMKKLGMNYTIERSPMSAVNREWSRTNGARVGESLDTNHVEELAQHARQGHPFKRSVCVRRKFENKDKGELGILGGNHRDACYQKAGVTEFEHYLVDTAGLEMVDWSVILPCLLNSVPFKAMSEEDKIFKALQWEEKGYMSLAESAKNMGLKVEYLKQRQKQAGIVKLLNEAKVAGVNSQLNNTKLVALATIGNDRVKVKAATLAIKADYTKAEVQTFANMLRKVAKDEATQLEYIRKIEERLAVDKAKGPPSTPLQSIRTTWLRQFHGTLDIMRGKSKLAQVGIDEGYQFYEDTIKELREMGRLCRVFTQSSEK